ncbi:MAG: hypothetical protein ACYC9K_08805 [Sulfuricaulis sp.]
MPINNSGKDPVLSFLRNILLGTTIVLVSTAANAASVTLVNVANSQVRDGAYAGFYTLNIDGQNVLAMCNDFSTTSTVGETWTAYFNTQGGINSGAGKFYPNTVGYHQTGYLFSLTPSVDYSHQASIDEAIWKIMTPGAPFTLSGDALTYYNTATGGAYDSFDYSNVMRVLTPDPHSASQEFLVAAVPLPSALWLLFSGVVGLFGFACRQRRLASSVDQLRV